MHPSPFPPSRCLLLLTLALAACATSPTARQRFEAERDATLQRQGRTTASTPPHALVIVPEAWMEQRASQLFGAEQGPEDPGLRLDLPGGFGAGMKTSLRKGQPRLHLSERCSGCLHVEMPVSGRITLDLRGPLPLPGGSVGMTGTVGVDFQVTSEVKDDAIRLWAQVAGDPQVKVSLDLGGVMGPLRPLVEVSGKDGLASWAKSLLPGKPVPLGFLPGRLSPSLPLRVTSARIINLHSGSPSLGILAWTDIDPSREPSMDLNRIRASSSALTLAVDEAVLEEALKRAMAARPPSGLNGALGVLMRGLLLEQGEAKLAARAFLLAGRGAEWDATARMGVRVEESRVAVMTREIRVVASSSRLGGLAPGEDDLEKWRQDLAPSVPRLLPVGGGDLAFRVDEVGLEPRLLRVVGDLVSIAPLPR